jgi:hypothetical protein
MQDTIDHTQTLVHRLLKAGKSHDEIAALFNGAVSVRSVYRWAKGEHAPKSLGIIIALENALQVATEPAKQ